MAVCGVHMRGREDSWDREAGLTQTSLNKSAVLQDTEFMASVHNSTVNNEADKPLPLEDSNLKLITVNCSVLFQD